MSEFKKRLIGKYNFAKCKMNHGIKPKGRAEKAAFKHKDKIDRCLANLKEPYSSIFSKTYLENSDKFWWCDIYPSTTYYRYLKEARTQFFQIFYRGNL